MKISSEENAMRTDMIVKTWSNTLYAIEDADPDLYVDTLRRINTLIAEALDAINATQKADRP